MFAELNGMKFPDRVAELNGMKFPDRVTYQKSVLMYKILLTYSILSSRVLYLHIRYSSEITKIILRHHVKQSTCIAEVKYKYMYLQWAYP